MLLLQLPPSLLTLVYITSSVTGVLAQQINVPHQSICNGLSDTGPGGMFGYSISITTEPSMNLSWIAIGKPWDGTVHIYAAQNPNQTLLVTHKNLANYTTRWRPIIQLSDTNNGTYPARPYGYFGSSVSLSQDGTWLAVGIPGRVYADVALQKSRFEGEVRLYRRILNASDVFSSRYILITTIMNPNNGPSPVERFWDRFGTKVLLKTREGLNDTWLFISSPSGWDGASVRFTESGGSINGVNFPIGPTTDVSRAGVYVYQITNSSRVTTAAQQTDVIAFRQFIRIQAKVPLGNFGPEFDVYEDTNNGSFVMLMRDFVFPPTVPTTRINNECPHLNCSYLVTNFVNGSQSVTGSVGAVVEYRMNANRSFQETGNRMYSWNFKFDDGIDTSKLNAGHSRDDWRRQDWFGLGVTAGKDEKLGRYVTVVGAPRDGTGVFSFYRPLQPLTSSDMWSNGQFIQNQKYWKRSFFGARMAMTPDSRFLVVADASGVSDSFGRGQVYLYYRRSGTELVYPESIASGNLGRITSRSPLQFDLLNTFRKTAAPLNATSYRSDQFGVGLAVNKFFAVVGAPMDDCVYLYHMPTTVETSPSVSVPPQLDQYTIVLQSTPVPEPTIRPRLPEEVATQTSQAWLYAVIAAIASLVVLLPVLIWFLMKRQREAVLKSLQEAEYAFDTAAFPTAETLQ